MAQRINEDVRFYLPADPYYYQVDNLPLEDLLSNDVRLQAQIDEINSAGIGNTVGRDGFTELQPFIDTGLPGTVSVRPGNFIGRAQRTNGGGLYGSVDIHRMDNGIWDNNNPPTTFGTGDNPTGTYSVGNPSNNRAGAGNGVGRTASFNFKGASVSIDGFDFNAFENEDAVTPPLGRIDLIGITTMNGAMDDPYLPGNTEVPGVLTGDGLPRLAVVKGAGITTANNGVRQVVVGEKYITVGKAQNNINDFGRNLDGDIVPNPEFGTVPSPDDVVNVNFARDLMANGEFTQLLNQWADSNKNANFFLPIAYVYVPQSHVEGNPIPEQYLKDIRPFFRTAELAIAERQAIAASLSPSINNPFTTVEHSKGILAPVADDLQSQITNLTDALRGLQGTNTVFFTPKDLGQITGTRTTFLTAGARRGVPTGAYAVILRGEMIGDIDNVTIRGYVGGAYNDQQITRGAGASQSGADSADTNQMQLQLKADGTFTAITVGAQNTSEWLRLWLVGYVMKTDFASL